MVASATPSLRTLGRSHFLSLVGRCLKRSASKDLQERFEEELHVPVATQDAPITQARMFGFDIPVFQGVEVVPGEALVEALTGQGPRTGAAERHDGIYFGFDIWASIGLFLADEVHQLGEGIHTAPDAPVVDILERSILKSLEGRYGKLRSPWPGNAPFALGLSHDVDRVRKTFQHVTHPIRQAARGHLGHAAQLAGHLDPRAYWCFDKVEALERKFQVASTYFFLHGSPEGKPKALRERILLSGVTRLDNPEVIAVVGSLNDAGCEIGLHSSSCARGDLGRLAVEKRLIERIVKHEVAGVRQHFLAQHVSDLWPNQVECGFGYDSTMGFGNRVGFRAGSCFPYPVGNHKAFHELPFEIMDGGVARYEDRWATCKAMIDEVAAVGGVLGLLWHQRFFNETEFPGFSELYERIISECKRRGAWIAPLGTIVERWRERPL